MWLYGFIMEKLPEKISKPHTDSEVDWRILSGVLGGIALVVGTTVYMIVNHPEEVIRARKSTPEVKKPDFVPDFDDVQFSTWYYKNFEDVPAKEGWLDSDDDQGLLRFPELENGSSPNLPYKPSDVIPDDVNLAPSDVLQKP